MLLIPYQVVSASNHDCPFAVVDLATSLSRIKLAIKGITPIENMSTRATVHGQNHSQGRVLGGNIRRCLVLIFNDRRSGIGKINRIKSVPTFTNP